MDLSQPHSSHAHSLKICSYRQSLTTAEFTVCWNVARVRLMWELKGWALCVAVHVIQTDITELYNLNIIYKVKSSSLQQLLLFYVLSADWIDNRE